MNDPVAANPPRSNRSFWLVGFIALVAVALGVYLIASAPRKPTELTQSASNLRRLAAGPMAAFVVKSAADPTVNIVFKDESGADTSLEKWRGRVVLLNLWATWCAPCRKEMPELDTLQQKLGSPDFEVIALSLDRQGADTARKFLNETGATHLKLYVDATAKTLESLRAPGLPTSILFDRQGREVGRLAGAADWASPEAIALVENVIADKQTP